MFLHIHAQVYNAKSAAAKQLAEIWITEKAKWVCVGGGGELKRAVSKRKVWVRC